MKALFCPDLFQDFYSLKFDGLNIVNYHQQKDVDNGFSLSYEVANHLAQEAGLETSIFIPDDPGSIEIYGNINCNYQVIIPEIYNEAPPASCYKTFLKMLSFASMKESFVFLSCGTLIKDRDLFVKNLYNNSLSNLPYLISYRKCIPTLNHNKILVDFWRSILPDYLRFEKEEDYQSYDLSFFIARDISLINEVAKEMCELIINNKELIENIYFSQSKVGNPKSSGFKSLNPDFSYLIECILFPLLLKTKSDQKSVDLICSRDISVTAEASLEDNFDPTGFNSHSISSFFMKNDIFNKWGVIMIDTINYDSWKEIYYNYYRENNLNRIQI